jgi:NAD(P)-dependent dehydrogenase (short-subunit alcohol dehydrogenase family)
MSQTPGPHRAVVILGALSGVAVALARLYAAEGARLLLVGRGQDRLERLAADLRVRGAGLVLIEEADLDSAAGDAAARIAAYDDRLGGLDHVYVVYGLLGDARRAETDGRALKEIIDVNLVSPALWCAAAAQRLRQRGGGAIVAISSVAGDRGRASNYPYGAAKGGLAIFIQGLAHALHGTGVRAVAIKLGFVVTPMTEGMNRSGPLWKQPADIAPLIRRAAERGPPIQYAPGFWRLIMLAIRLLPSVLIHRTRL